MIFDTIRYLKGRWYNTRYIVLYTNTPFRRREVIRKIFKHDNEWVTFGLTVPDCSSRHAFTEGCFVRIEDNGFIVNDRRASFMNEYNLKWNPYIPFQTKINVPDKLNEPKFPTFKEPT